MAACGCSDTSRTDDDPWWARRHTRERQTRPSRACGVVAMKARLRVAVALSVGLLVLGRRVCRRSRRRRFDRVVERVRLDALITEGGRLLSGLTADDVGSWTTESDKPSTTSASIRFRSASCSCST